MSMEKRKLKSSDGVIVEIREHKPYFSVPVKMLEAAKKWEVGKKYKLAMEVRQVRMMEDEHMMDVGFEIQSVKEA